MIKAGARAELEIRTQSCLDLDHLYGLEDVDAAIDYIYSKVEISLWAGHDAQHWPDIEAMLDTVELCKLDSSVIVTLPMAVLAIKDRLGNYKELYQRVYSLLSQRHGFEEARGALEGLE